MTRNLKLTIFSIIILSISTLPLQAQLKKTIETAGVNFQWHRFSTDGVSTKYMVLAIPFRVVYEPTRYASFSVILNQGYQSFEDNSLYGLGNLHVEYKQMLTSDIGFLKAEDWTFQARVTAPTGKKELEPQELAVASTGRIPYVKSPLSYAASGFGFKVGTAYGSQVGENTSIGFGVSYDYRGSYKPIKGSGDFDPSDEILFAAGLDIGDETGGFIGDFRFALYNNEKLDSIEISSPGNAFSASGQVFLGKTELMALYYDRKETEFQFGTEFKSPSVLAVRLGQRFDFLGKFIPYVGYERSGEGDRIFAADVFLLGGYTKNMRWGGFPFNPYIELKYGNIGDDANTLAVRVGTSLAFQLYY